MVTAIRQQYLVPLCHLRNASDYLDTTSEWLRFNASVLVASTANEEAWIPRKNILLLTKSIQGVEFLEVTRLVIVTSCKIGHYQEY